MLLGITFKEIHGNFPYLNDMYTTNLSAIPATGCNKR